MQQGCFALVLHAHLPFVRHPEYEDPLEERWLEEAVTESYVPLLLEFEGLLDEGVDFRVTMSLTPTLTSMLLDPLLQSRVVRRLEGLLELSRNEIRRTRKQPGLHELARMYHRRFLRVHDAFNNRYQQNLVQAFRRFEDLGRIELIASAATHGYLPLLCSDPGSVRAQVRVGVEHHRELFGRPPKGFWLPECGYYPGVDKTLSESGIRYTILETHGVTRAEPRPVNGAYAPLVCPSGVAVFGRDPESSKQVWSSTEGYPGDFDYREFYRDIGYDLDRETIGPYIHSSGIRVDTGIKYHRITSKQGPKELYDPERAARKVEAHARDFLYHRMRQIARIAPDMEEEPIIVAPYDAELFGHWWFEGPRWIGALFRKIAREQQVLRPVTLSGYVDAHPAVQTALPCMSSWGDRGFNDVWLNGTNDWIYPHLHQAAQVMRQAARRCAGGNGIQQRALAQAGRELLLAQASDWAFMINAGTTAEYATRRIETHLLRMHRLCREAETNTVDPSWLSALENQDNPFPRLRGESFL